MFSNGIQLRSGLLSENISITLLPPTSPFNACIVAFSPSFAAIAFAKALSLPRFKKNSDICSGEGSSLLYNVGPEVGLI